MNRQVWKCPECIFWSTRKWNSQQHMKRAHPHSMKKIKREEREVRGYKVKFCWNCGAKQ